MSASRCLIVLAVLTSAIWIAACETFAPSTGRSVGVRDVVERIEPSNDSARILPAAFPDIFPRVASVRAVPSVVELKEGDRLDLRDVKLWVIDAEGQPLGHLAIFDRSLEPGAAVLDDRGGVIARHAGTSEAILSAPLWSASGGQGTAPYARLVVEVRP
jgi:hypothetical protein